MLAMSDTEHEVAPDLSDFMRLVAQQATTSQHAQQYDGNRTEKFVAMIAHWITDSRRLPASATVTRTTPDTLVMTVTMDNANAAIALPAAPT